jgi:hypothetical protein
MGAPASIVPDSASAVADYYASIADQYEPLPAFQAAQPVIAVAAMRPARWRDVKAMPIGAGLEAANVVALAVIPRPARRLNGVPATLDPVLDRALSAIRPSFAPLAIPKIGDRVLEGSSAPTACNSCGPPAPLSQPTSRRRTRIATPPEAAHPPSPRHAIERVHTRASLPSAPFQLCRSVEPGALSRDETRSPSERHGRRRRSLGHGR